MTRPETRHQSGQVGQRRRRRHLDGALTQKTRTVAAPSLLAMVPWKTSLGSPKDPRPRLVHFSSRRDGFELSAWHRANTFATTEMARLCRDFRCVLLPHNKEGAFEKRFGVWGGRWPPVLFLTPDGEEIDRYGGG